MHPRSFLILLVFLAQLNICHARLYSEKEKNDTLHVTDTFSHIDLSRYSTIYTDSNCTNFNGETNKQLSSLDEHWLLKLRSTGYIRFWIKFTVQNNSDKHIAAILNCGVHPLVKITEGNPPGSINEAGFFSYQNSGLHTLYGIPLTLQANSVQSFVIEISSLYKMQTAISPELFSTLKYAENEIANERSRKPTFAIQLLLLGGIFVLSIFNLAQFMSNRDSAYLFYSLYSFSLFLYIERSLELSNDMRIVSQVIPTYFHDSVNFYTLLIGIFYMLFLKRFLNPVKPSWLLKVANGFLYLLLTAIFLVFFIHLFRSDNFFPTRFNMLVTFLPFISFTIIAIILIPECKKKILPRYIIAGSFLIMAGGLIQVFLNNYSNQFMSRIFAPVTYLEIGALGELFFFALGLGYKRKQLEKEKKNAELQKMTSELQLLRTQMNPHFIFNCLNSIKLYAEKNDMEAATTYLSKFSRLMRLVLENSKNSQITLKQEIETIRLYLDMEAMRFKEKLQYQIIVDKNADPEYTELPPMLIQPYVENAIWHGLMHKEGGGLITVHVSEQDEMLVISVKDNGIGREKAAALKSRLATTHKSFGMNITGERLELLNAKNKTNANISVNDLYENGVATGTEVIIKIPVG